MKYFLTFIIFALSFSPLSAKDKKPKNLYALVAADTFSDSYFRPNISLMQDALKSISKDTHLRLKMTTLQGISLTKQTIASWISSLPLNSNDVVFVYLSAHGSRAGHIQKDPFPIVFFSYKKEALSIHFLQQYISKEKKPRLLVVLADSCNKIVVEKSPLILKSSKTMKTSPILKSLFLRSKGVVTIGSASPGEYAVGGVVLGGAYTYTFSKILTSDNISEYPAGSWKEFLKAVSLAVSKVVPTQHAIYEVKPRK